jgi:hypothetical protein
MNANTLESPSTAGALASLEDAQRDELAAHVEEFNAEICPASRVRLLHRIRTLRRELGLLEPRRSRIGAISCSLAIRSAAILEQRATAANRSVSSYIERLVERDLRAAGLISTERPS